MLTLERGDGELKRELSVVKSFEQQQKQEIQTLMSKLADEKQKNIRTENLLELRGEYIKTLQESDDINKNRIVLQIKEIGMLREKQAKAKKFKLSGKEELNNLYETLKSQQFEIDQLNHKLQQKDL